MASPLAGALTTTSSRTSRRPCSITSPASTPHTFDVEAESERTGYGPLRVPAAEYSPGRLSHTRHLIEPDRLLANRCFSASVPEGPTGESETNRGSGARWVRRTPVVSA